LKRKYIYMRKRDHIASVHTNKMSAKIKKDIGVATVAWDVYDSRSENEVIPS
jgi:hypothetical protein